jgi:hypothetical protein
MAGDQDFHSVVLLRVGRDWPVGLMQSMFRLGPRKVMAEAAGFARDPIGDVPAKIG